MRNGIGGTGEVTGKLFLTPVCYLIMQDQSFTIHVNDIAYTVKLHSAVPRLYDVSGNNTYHRIGKTDAGLWVYVEDSPGNQHMPLQQIGEAIDDYVDFNID